MSEQVNYGETDVDARLISHSDDAVLPVGVHDFAKAVDRCMLVDKTMFIADVLDCDASVVVCCRPEGFGKSMNLSMLKAFLECPVMGRADPGMFAGTQIWDAEEGFYRDEYACYPVIVLDFSSDAKRGTDAVTALRDAVAHECARLLPQLAAPDLPSRKVRHIERVARGVASPDETDAVLGVLIELLQVACDEQVVLLVDEYDAAWSNYAGAKRGHGVAPTELLERVLFDAIASAGDSLRLACLMGERPGPAEAALTRDGCSFRLATPLSSWYDYWFGFSDAECQALLGRAGCKDCLDEAREWLEGYRFGEFYCENPGRLISYMDRGCKPPARTDLYGYADRLSNVMGDCRMVALKFR